VAALRDVTLRLGDGSRLVLPATLSSATTYTIAEQERWFEKDLDIVLAWLKPGMTAIDIGANLGAYTIPMARRVGERGVVHAYEPGSEARAFLAKSGAANPGIRLELRSEALSDRPRQGRLLFGASSELNRLQEASRDSDPGESVPITSLDHEDEVRGWSSPDFVKLDAEGEENNILAGGRSFFTRHSPLVMMEVRQGASVNYELIEAFRALGYGVFRALPTIPLLLPFAAGDEIDGYELNLFAAKPERAAALAREGLLIETLPAFAPSDRARPHAVDALRSQPFAASFARLLSVPIEPAYRDALASYAPWRNTELALPVRCAALMHACATLLRLCEHSPNLARLSTLARIGWEAGRRSVTVVALQAFGATLQRGAAVSEPFWPANPRFDAIAPGPQPQDWFIAAAFELYERSKNLSSFYGASGVDLDWLCQLPYATAELERRRVLQAWRAGRPIAIPERLRTPAPDNVNAELWRSGAIANNLCP
jgi:FkbM family methyltransferase